MGMMDAFNAEDRVQVKFSDFYNLMRGCAERDILMNGIETLVPHQYMHMMMTGKNPYGQMGDNEGGENHA